MKSFSAVFGKNVYCRIGYMCTSSWYIRLYFILNVITAVLSLYTNALYLDNSVANIVLCADPKCEGEISLAETQGSYPSRDTRILSFKPGEEVRVYAKPTYEKMKLVFGEIRGKKGYIPMNMIREKKIVKQRRDLVTVVLPKGISNVVEDNSDNNSDKSTAGMLPLSDTIGSNVNQDDPTTVSDLDKEEITKNEIESLSNSEDRETKTGLNAEKTNSQKSSIDENSKIEGDIEDNKVDEIHKSELTNRALNGSIQDKPENKMNSTVKIESLNASNTVVIEESKTLLPEKSEISSIHSFTKDKNNSENKQTNNSQPENKINSSVESLNTEAAEEPKTFSSGTPKISHNHNVTKDKIDSEDKQTNKNLDIETLNFQNSDVDKNTKIKGDSEDMKSEDTKIDVKNDDAKVDVKSEQQLENNDSVLNSNVQENTQPEEAIEEPKPENSTINFIKDKTNSEDRETTKNLDAETTKFHHNDVNKNDKIKDDIQDNSQPKSKVNSAVNIESQNTRNPVAIEVPQTSVDSESLNTTNQVATDVPQTSVDSESLNTTNQMATDVPQTSVDSESLNTTNQVATDVPQTFLPVTQKKLLNHNFTKDETNLEKMQTNKSLDTEKMNSQNSGVDKNNEIEGNSENGKVDISNEQVQTTNNEAILGIDIEENNGLKYKINSSVGSESMSTTNMVATEEPETLRPEAVLESSPIHNHYGDDSVSASILFTIIPREYIDILRIYVTIFSDMLPDNLKIILASLRISSHVVVLTFLFGVLWLTMYFIGSLFNLFNKDSSIRAELCDFQVKFFKMKSERDCLRRLLQTEEEKCFEFDEKISEKEQKIAFLEKEYERVKKERVELQEKVISLEADVTNATDAGLEMNAVLSDFLTSQKENVSLNSKVESLQLQITKQEEFISQLRKSYRSTKEENAELKHIQEKTTAELERLTRLLDDTDTNLKKFQSNNEALKSSNSEMLQQLKELEESKTSLVSELRKLEEEKEERDALTKQLQEEIISLNSVSEAKTSEVKSLQEVIRSLKEDTEDNVDDLFDVAKMKTELDVIQKEKNDIESKYESVISEREKLLETVKSLQESSTKSKESEEKALKEKVDAQNNLEILKDYFATKEAEYQQKVGTLQVIKQQREEDTNSLSERLKFLEDENNAYRSQLETMKNELIDSDKNWKAQLARMEKKAHENWVAFRNAQRELEATKSDSAALRQHLSMKARSTVDGNSNLDDEEPLSIPSFLPPPPPFTGFPTFEDKGDAKRWEASPNFISPPPPPPLPSFGVDFENMPPMPPPFNSFPSHHQSLSHPIGNHPMQWDSPSSRDAFSPISQQSHERRSSRGNSPMHSTISGSSIRGTMPTAPNFAPFTPHPMYGGSAQFSNPASHWTRPNGNVTNNAVNKQNHEKKKSRSDSRNSISNSSLHASNV